MPASRSRLAQAGVERDRAALREPASTIRARGDAALRFARHQRSTCACERRTPARSARLLRSSGADVVPRAHRIAVVDRDRHHRRVREQRSGRRASRASRAPARPPTSPGRRRQGRASRSPRRPGLARSRFRSPVSSSAVMGSSFAKAARFYPSGRCDRCRTRVRARFVLRRMTRHAPRHERADASPTWNCARPRTERA